MKKIPYQRIRRISAGLLASATLLAVMPACTSSTREVQDSTYDYSSRQKGDPKMIGPRLYGRTTRSLQQHNNRFFEYSDMLSREVAAVNGVGSGIVMLTDKNAYAAITLMRAGYGTQQEKLRDQNYNASTEHGGAHNNPQGKPFGNGTEHVTPYHSYFTVNDHNAISPELKQTIARRIRELAPHVGEVHISANMDFVNDMTDYAKMAWSGQPLQPWLADFNTLVKYQFASGTIMPVPLQQLWTIRRNGAAAPPAQP